MNATINIHALGAAIKMVSGRRNGVFWLSMSMGEIGRNEVTVFVAPEDYGRLCRAAEAFNAALAEPEAAPLTLAAE